VNKLYTAWTMKIRQREIACILAALRFWQRAVRDGGGIPYSDIAGQAGAPLSAEEVDELCEFLSNSYNAR